MVKDPEQLTDTERLCLDHIQQESTVVKVYELAQQFIAMIKQAWGEQLNPWLTACSGAGIRQIQSFAWGIRQDYAAVEAALAILLQRIRALWDKLSQEATIIEPLAQSAWAQLFGMLTDRFGVTWILEVS